MKNIAIITARGGSKRIPGKNIKEFMGKPMIAYAIEAALESKIFDEVMVSTDSDEIAKVSKQYGAKVPFLRSQKSSNDFASTYDVLEEVVLEYEKNNIHFDNVCCIYPCVPFLTPEKLRDAYAKFVEKDTDALIPVCKYDTPIEWALKLENGILTPVDREAKKMRSQDLVPKYRDVGMFYFLKKTSLIKYQTIWPENTFGYIIEESECQDIDTPEDWQMAEIKYKVMGSCNL